MDARQDFAFKIDDDTQKLVTVLHQGGSIDVTVRYAGDVVLDEVTTRIGNVTEPTIETDEHGVVIVWRAPLLPRIGWPMVSRRRRF